MALLDKKTIREIGFAFTGLFLICAIISIILAGISYRFAGPDWKPNPWMNIPPLQVASVIYAIFLSLFGFIVFAKPNIAITITYTVLLLISVLFTLAIAILCLVAGSHGFVNTYFGCNGKFSGIMEVWQGIDAYLQRIDQNLCSDQCPCSITNTAAFTTNSTVLPFYNKWIKTNNFGTPNFQGCVAQVQKVTQDQAALDDKFFNPDNNFNRDIFANYMSRVENDFKCSGWCNVTYVDPKTTTSVTMYKYMFTDVNRGPSQNLGCLTSVINWLPPYLHAWGSTMMVMAGFQIVVLIMSICQCWARERDHELQIPHHHDDDRK